MARDCLYTVETIVGRVRSRLQPPESFHMIRFVEAWPDQAQVMVLAPHLGSEAILVPPNLR